MFVTELSPSGGMLTSALAWCWCIGGAIAGLMLGGSGLCCSMAFVMAGGADMSREAVI